jgi:hypothetical protein
MSTAVLMDVMSIQRYVFNSNALKENLGASHNIEHFYDIFNHIKGFTGGGNALLLFDSKEKAETEIKKFMVESLTNYPGLTISCVCEENFDETNYKESLKNLFLKMQAEKNKNIPITSLLAHGITSECPKTGFSAETFYKDVNQPERSGYISSASYSKIASAKKAEESAQKILKDMGLAEKYVFSNELDKLGQEEGVDSYISIVHIDGNDMGARFSASNSLEKSKNLSTFLKELVKESFKKIISTIDVEIDGIKDCLSLKEEGGKIILPVRSIIMGGDDVTFVSEGRLGIYLASVFMKEFEKGELPNEEKFTSCAGIAIVKTKYPFYRAYRLAEELCRSAKNTRKEKRQINPSFNSSFFDFHLSSGGLAGSMKDIRDKQFRNAEGNSVLYRPYDISDFEGVDNIISSIKQMKKDLPNSKIKELQRVLTLSKSEQADFLGHMKFRGEKLPSVLGEEYQNNLFLNSRTPFFDMVEMMGLIPQYVIERGGF